MNPRLVDFRKQSPADPVQACSLLKRHAIEALVLGEDDAPVIGITLRLVKGPGQSYEETTGPDGLVRFDGLVPGSYSIQLPDHDRDAWKSLRVEALDGGAQESSGDLEWSSERQPDPLPPSHVAEQGDCLSILAFRWGLAPETVWNYSGNTQLRSARKSMHILAPGDEIAIPEKRVSKIDASVDNRYVLRLIGVPEILRVRFVTPGFDPRAGVPYLLQIETEDGSIVPDRKGKTASDGFLREPIPPNAVKGEIWLGQGLDIEKYTIRLGYIDPLSTVRGVQARLNNLGCHCGEEDGVLDDRTRDALRLFQTRMGLPVTGEPDAATKSKLEDLHRS